MSVGVTRALSTDQGTFFSYNYKHNINTSNKKYKKVQNEKSRSPCNPLPL